MSHTVRNKGHASVCVLQTPKMDRKTGASFEAQRYCSNTDPGSDNVRKHPDRSKHIIHGQKLKKGKTLLLRIKMCHSSVFISMFWKGCYQSRTPGGRFGRQP